jgi:hypothetical protein
MKNSNDTIGNRTRDHPACSAVPRWLGICDLGDEVFSEDGGSVSRNVSNYWTTLCCNRDGIVNIVLEEFCALLGYYAKSSCNPLPTFRDNVSIPSSRIKKSKKKSGPFKMGQIRCPETSVKCYHSTLRNTPEERTSHQHRGGSLKPRIVLQVYIKFVAKNEERL